MNLDFSYEYARDNDNQIVCWKAQNNNFWPHFHSSIELLYVTSGKIKVTLNGQVYLVKKHDFLIIPSYYIHSYVTENTSSAYILIIPLDAVPSYKSTFVKKTFATLLIENPKIKEELAYCLKSLSTLKSSVQLAAENMEKGYTYILLGLLINQTGLIDITDTKMISLAQEILIYLQENYLKRQSLEDIAKHFGYSKSRFSHIFNEYFNCRLIEYINGLRCRHALELLLEKKDTITDIALACGFDSTRTFYRAFFKSFGCTPNDYITNH